METRPSDNESVGIYGQGIEYYSARDKPCQRFSAFDLLQLYYSDCPLVDPYIAQGLQTKFSQQYQPSMHFRPYLWLHINWNLPSQVLVRLKKKHAQTSYHDTIQIYLIVPTNRHTA